MKLLGEYKNGNYTTKIYSDGTKIRQTEEDAFTPDFAENIDIKICDYCDAGCPMCHEGSSLSGKFGNIMVEEFIDTLHPYQEVAIGGGDCTSHPDLIPFLYRLKRNNIITNITVNQQHFEEKQDLIRELYNRELIHGLGISLVNPTDDFVKLVQEYPNAVIHAINGIVSEKDIDKLSGHGLKLLILGYKKLRRGEEWFKLNEEIISSRQNWLKDNLNSVINGFSVVSFDNFAIEQLDVRDLMSQEEWDRFYMGDDAEFSFYIDMVNREFAKTSTEPIDKRYPLKDNADQMFDYIRVA